MTQNKLDLAIIGSGPAALTAAIYAARAGLSVKVFEKTRFGGALPDISHLTNFPGFVGSGEDFTTKLVEQAKSSGADIVYGTCTSISPLIIDDEQINTRAVLIATGTEPKKLGTTTNRPVSYCALCDAPLFRNKNILVVGGGNSAVSQAIYLAPIVKKLALVNRSPLRAETALVKKLRTLPNVTILEPITITSELLDKYDGIFVFIGKQPATSFVLGAELDSEKYLITDEHYMTTIPGVFAAGDVRSGSTKQAITAAADGAIAVTHIINYIHSL